MRAKYVKARTALEWRRYRNAWMRSCIRRLIDKEKRKRCADCHRKYPPYVMEFDHCRGPKRFNLNQARSAAAFYRELEKCDVVCANCHKIRTHNRRQRGKTNGNKLWAQDGRSGIPLPKVPRRTNIHQADARPQDAGDRVRPVRGGGRQVRAKG